VSSGLHAPPNQFAHCSTLYCTTRLTHRWGTAPDSVERSKVRYVVVQGPSDGHAVAIIDGEGCPGKSPALPPSHGGSQLFLYHAGAVDDFRKTVLTRFFVDYAKKQGKTLDATKFYNDLKSLQSKQLAAVLTLLAPANAVPIWSVKIRATPAPSLPAVTTTAARTNRNK